jgi:hypothetical protein
MTFMVRQRSTAGGDNPPIWQLVSYILKEDKEASFMPARCMIDGFHTPRVISWGRSMQYRKILHALTLKILIPVFVEKTAIICSGV